MVLVIHDINFAANYSDRILAMKHGRLEEVFELPVDIQRVNGRTVGICC